MTVQQLLDLLRGRLAALRGAGATYRDIAARMRHPDGRRYNEGTLRNVGAGAPAGLGFAQDLIDALPELAAPPVPVCPCCRQLVLRDLTTCHRTMTRRRGPLLTRERSEDESSRR